MSDNGQDFVGPGAPTSGEYRIMRAEKTNGSSLKPRDWISIVGILVVIIGAISALSTTVFRSKADGVVADAKFSAHVEAQKIFEGDVKEALKEIKQEIKSVGTKLDRYSGRLPRIER